MKDEFLLDELKHYIYYIEGRPYVQHFLVGECYEVNINGKSKNNYLTNNQYLGKNELYEEYYYNGEFEEVLTLLDKHKRMGWFIQNHEEIYENSINEDLYYQLLRENLVYVDNHGSYRKEYPNLINIGSNPHLMMFEDERKKFDKLPNEFVVYRGVSSNKKITKRNVQDLLGNSWSLDREISIWFSINHSSRHLKSKYLFLLTYQVSKTEVLSYFTDRNEEEIFLDHTRIDINKISFEEIPKNYQLKVSFDKG